MIPFPEDHQSGEAEHMIDLDVSGATTNKIGEGQINAISID